MPFSALFDGEPVISLLMSDVQWEQAKAISKQEENRLLVGHSRLPGFARTSPLGLRHFAHRKGYAPDYEWAESAEHQALKAELVRAIAARGWQVDAEVPSGPEREWIADVLAERDGERIAFEVQWSKQSAEEYVRRTKRYAAAGIECVWFIRHYPKLDARDVTDEAREDFARVMVFPLQNTENLSRMIAVKNPDYRQAMLAKAATVSKSIDTGSRTLPVEQLAKLVLDGQLRVKSTFSAIVYVAACHRCKQEAIYWHLPTLAKGRAKVRPETDVLLLPEVRRASAVLDPDLLMARFRQIGEGLAAASEFACPHCDAVQGRALEAVNITKASRAKRGLRFEAPLDERWKDFALRYQLRTATQVKLNV